MTAQALKQAHLPIVVKNSITRGTPKVLQYIYITDLKNREFTYPDPVVPLYVMLFSNAKAHYYAVRITLRPTASDVIKVYGSVFKPFPLKLAKRDMVQQLFDFPTAF